MPFPSSGAFQAHSRVVLPVLLALAGLFGLGLLPPAAHAQSRLTMDANEPTGPIRLQQRNEPDKATERQEPGQRPVRNELDEPPGKNARGDNPKQRRGGEFEEYVRRIAGDSPVERLGEALITGTDTSPDANPQIPPDYLIQPGDEIQLALWGSVDADLRMLVDRSGRISVPRVGSIMVSGVRYADLPAVISRRVGLVFKNFELSASLGRLRGQRVYVTGFVAKPGSYTVSSLATLVSALMSAGGPSAAGSFRDVQLRRGRNVVGSFDLYELLLKGDRGNDIVLQPEDVIFVGPVGAQVGVIGSVNRPSVVELKPGETLTEALRMTGGFSAVADTTRVSLERLEDRATVRVTQLPLPASRGEVLRNGDVVRAFNAVIAALPVQGQNRRVVVEGEVLRPGEYVLPANTTLSDALRAAGGLTPSAFIFGTELSRESVRATQQANYDRALRDLEIELSRSSSTQRTTTADEAAALTGRQSSVSRLVERLRQVKPTGRIVLQLPVNGGSLPDLAMEDGDRLYVPPRPTSVGVFGSVFNAGSYLYQSSRTMQDYLRLAGGPTKGADDKSIFVVRANGTVISRLQNSGSFGFRDDFGGVTAEPGDTIFVPEEFDKTTFVQNAKDWSQVLYQLGLGAAGLKALGLF